jgi:5-methylcytosine-specific restriction endonuclease McrA
MRHSSRRYSRSPKGKARNNTDAAKVRKKLYYERNKPKFWNPSIDLPAFVYVKCCRCNELKLRNNTNFSLYRKTGKFNGCCKECKRVESSIRYRENKDYHKENSKKNRLKDPLRYRAYFNNYRAKVLQNGGSFTKEDVRFMYEIQEGRCHYCSKELDDKYEIDHRTPVSRGGTSNRDNLCLACVKCNRSKNSKTEEEYREWKFTEMEKFGENLALAV